jgi:hypothetical protein
MTDPTDALLAVAGSLVSVIAAWLKKVRKDLNAIFPKVRRLEERVSALEASRDLPDLPSCLLDCPRRETPPSTGNSTRS